MTLRNLVVIRGPVPPVGANHTEWHAARDREIRVDTIDQLDTKLEYKGGPDIYVIDGDVWRALRAALLGLPPPQSHFGQGGP